MGNFLGCFGQHRGKIVTIVVVCGNDEITEVGRRYSRSQVVEVNWRDDGGFGADDRFYLLQQEVVAEVVEIEVGGYF